MRRLLFLWLWMGGCLLLAESHAGMQIVLKEKKTKAQWPDRHYFLRLPKDRDGWVRTVHRATDGEGGLDAMWLRPVGKPLGNRWAKVGKAGRLIEVSEAATVVLEGVHNEDSSILVINEHIRSDLNDLKILVQKEDRIYEANGVLDAIESQLLAKRLIPEDVDHRYLEARGIEGNIIRCNFSGEGHLEGLSVEVFFALAVRMEKGALKFAVLRRVKRQPGDRQGHLIVSPYNHHLVW